MKFKIIILFSLLILTAGVLASDFGINPSYNYLDDKEYVEIKIEIKNPTDSKLTETWSFELPSPLKASDIINLNGNKITVDLATERVTLYGEETLRSKSSKIKKVKVKNVWSPEKRIEEIEKLTNEVIELIDSIPKDSPHLSKALEIKEIAKQNLENIKKDLKTGSADKLIKAWEKSELVLDDLKKAKNQLELLLSGELEENKAFSASTVVFVFGTLSIIIALGLLWYAKSREVPEYEAIRAPKRKRRTPMRARTIEQPIRVPTRKPMRKPRYEYKIRLPERARERYKPRYERRIPTYRRRYPKRYEKYPRERYRKYPERRYPKERYPEYKKRRRYERLPRRSFVERRGFRDEIKKELVKELKRDLKWELRRGKTGLAKEIKRELIKELKEEFKRAMAYHR